MDASGQCLGISKEGLDGCLNDLWGLFKTLLTGFQNKLSVKREISVIDRSDWLPKLDRVTVLRMGVSTNNKKYRRKLAFIVVKFLFSLLGL